jgi:hypothetical protein
MGQEKWEYSIQGEETVLVLVSEVVGLPTSDHSSRENLNELTQHNAAAQIVV